MPRRHGLASATRAGGRYFAGRSSTRGVVIDVSPIRSVSVSVDVVTVGAGVTSGEVYEALQEHGLAIPAGTYPRVGGMTMVHCIRYLLEGLGCAGPFDRAAACSSFSRAVSSRRTPRPWLE